MGPKNEGSRSVYKPHSVRPVGISGQPRDGTGRDDHLSGRAVTDSL